MSLVRLPAELRIDSIASRLDPSENLFRHKLMDATISRGGPLNVHAEPPAELAGYDLKSMVEALAEKKAAVADEKGDINFIYPVSAQPTGHGVTLADGRRFDAMCAIDALGAAFAFQQDVAVRSSCDACESPVEVEVSDGRIQRQAPPEIHVLHVDLEKFDVWAGSA